MSSISDYVSINVPKGMTYVVGVLHGVAGDRFKIRYAFLGACSAVEDVIDYAPDGQTHYVGLCDIGYKNTGNPVILDVPGVYVFEPEAGNMPDARIEILNQYVTAGA